MKFKKHPLLIVFTTVIVATIITTSVLINFFLDSFVKDRISREIYKSSKGLYSIKIDDLDTRFWNGTVEMEKVLLYQDSSKLKTLQTENPNENISTVKLYIPSVQIHRIRWINYLISNDLKVGGIDIESPEILVTGSTFSEKIQETNRKFIELLPSIIAGFAGSLRIEEMKIKSGKLKYDIETQRTIIIQTAENIFLDLNDIIIDTMSRKKILYSEDIRISLSNYRLKTSDELYTLGIDKISGIVSDSTLQFEKLYYSKADTINKGDKATEIFIKNIKGERVSFHDFFYKKKIFIGKLFLESPDIAGIIDQRNSKGIAIGAIQLGSKSIFFVSPLISHIIESFTIDDIQANNGTIQNKTYTDHDIISQKADNVNLHIVKVAGVIVDSLRLKSPDHIDISFDNYELKLNNPEIKFTIERTKASSFDSIIRLRNSRICLKDERIKTKKIYINNSAGLVLANGFDLHALLDTGKISFKKIVITSPRTEFRTMIEKGTVTKHNSVNSNFGDLINSWNVDRIQIENGYFKNEAVITGDTVIQRAKNYNLTIQGISATNDKVIPNISGISGEFKDYELKVVKEKLIIMAELFLISSQKSAVVMKNLRINQYHPKTVKENIFNVTIPEFQINQFDLKRALYKSEFVAGAIMINNMKMNVFLKEGKVAKPDYAKLMPNEMTRAIPFYFRIDTIKISNGLFTSMEKKNASVIFTLNKMKLHVFNLTNDKKIMSLQSPARLVGETMLLNQGRISFTISVPLLSSKFNCSYNGKIGSMKAEAFQNVFSYANMKAEKGQIDSGSFVVNVSDRIVNGNLKLVYHDFHVKALDTTGKEKKMKSKIENFLIKNSNPSHKNEEPEIIQVTSKREPGDSIFSLLWRPIKEGVIKTVTKDTFVRD
jgi:hypothetical protein